MIPDEDWTFTSMDTKIGSPTFHTCGLKSIQWPHNIHTYLSVIASNVHKFEQLLHSALKFMQIHNIWIVNENGDCERKFDLI